MQTTSIALTSYTKILRQKDHEIVWIAEYEPFHQSTCTPVHPIFISQSSPLSFSVLKCTFWGCCCCFFILVEYFKTSKLDFILVDIQVFLFTFPLMSRILSVTLATQCISFRTLAKCSLVYCTSCFVDVWSRKREKQSSHQHTHTLGRPESCARRSLIHHTQPCERRRRRRSQITLLHRAHAEW